MGQQQVTVVSEHHLLVLTTSPGPTTATQARLTVSHEHWNGDPARRMKVIAGGHGHREVVHAWHVPLLALGSLSFVTVILKPDLHLCRRQSNQTGQVLSLGCRQVPLLLEPSLQLKGLLFGEENPSFPLLARHRIAAGLHITTHLVVIHHAVVILVLVLVARLQQLRVALLTSARLQVTVRLLVQTLVLITVAIAVVVV